MSDALTDIARDESRSKAIDRLINAFIAFIIESGPAERAIVQQRASECDGIPRGYWGGSTNFTERIETALGGLLAKEPTAWAWLLCLAKSQGHPGADELFQRSPWPGKRTETVAFDRHLDGLSRLLD